MQNIDELLKGEVERRFTEIADLEIGSDEATAAVKETGLIVDKVIEFEKIKLDCEKNNQLKKSDMIKNIITIGTFTASLLAFIWANIDSKNFEIGGHMHTTDPGRQSQRRMLNILDRFKQY